MADWMPNFSTFTTQEWLTFWSVVVAAAAVVANISVAIWNNLRTNSKLRELEDSMTTGLGALDDKVNAVDWNYAYVIGVLDGAGLTQHGRQDDG